MCTSHLALEQDIVVEALVLEIWRNDCEVLLKNLLSFGDQAWGSIISHLVMAILLMSVESSWRWTRPKL